MVEEEPGVIYWWGDELMDDNCAGEQGSRNHEGECQNINNRRAHTHKHEEADKGEQWNAEKHKGTRLGRWCSWNDLPVGVIKDSLATSLMTSDLASLYVSVPVING